MKSALPVPQTPTRGPVKVKLLGSTVSAPVIEPCVIVKASSTYTPVATSITRSVPIWVVASAGTRIRANAVP